MSTIFGLAGLTASDYQFAIQADHQLLFNALGKYLEFTNQARVDAASFFVQGTTELISERVKNPMTGKAQRRGQNANVDAVKPYDGHDVAYPLYDYSDEVNLTADDFAYMSPAQFQQHVDGVVGRFNSAYRSDVLNMIFKNTNTTFVDKRAGSQTIVPLANTDGVLYPPTIGNTADAEAEHYLTLGAASIDDTNDPYEDIVNLFSARFGRMTGGISVAILINTAQRAETEVLAAFVPYVPNTVSPGDDTDQVLNNTTIPGEIIGTIHGAWVSVWDYIPSGYMAGRYLGAPAPLIERNDPAATGLAGGVRMVIGPNEVQWPVVFNAWQWRYGVGTRERLNACVLQVTAGAYSIPTIA
jgi:hypothetical protein